MGERSVRLTLANAVERLRQELVDAPSGSNRTPYLDASLILAEAIGIRREQLFARMNDELSPEAAKRFGTLLDDRARGRPVSYVLGRKEFYGRTFVVDERVLVPRPETEFLIEAALGLRSAGLLGAGARCHDCCTGSGCIAITLALELPDLAVSASDVSHAALAIAAENARKLLGRRRRLELSCADLLPAGPTWQLITANPPYLSTAECDGLAHRGWPEPRVALDGGSSGIELPRRLIEAAFVRLDPSGYLIIEVGADQSRSIQDLICRAGYVDVRVTRDLAGHDRVVIARRGA